MNEYATEDQARADAARVWARLGLTAGSMIGIALLLALDVSQELRPVFRKGQPLFSDPAHFNVRGHREVGALLEPHLARFVPCP